MDFANNANIMDKKITTSELDIIFTAATNINDKNNPLNPPNALVRLQFIEALIRIAVSKLFQSKFYLKISEYLCKLM